MVGCVESALCAGAGFHWQQITFFTAYLVTILKALNWAFRKDFNPLCIWVALETISTHFELSLETWKYSLTGNPSDGEPLWCSRCFRFIQPDCTRTLQHQRNCLAGGRRISRILVSAAQSYRRAHVFFIFFTFQKYQSHAIAPQKIHKQSALPLVAT